MQDVESLARVAGLRIATLVDPKDKVDRRLVAGGRNVGESSVLAWAQVHGATAVVDDQDAV